MTKLSTNVHAFLEMRKAWQNDIAHGDITKAVRKINSAYLFRRNNFDWNDWQMLIKSFQHSPYQAQFNQIVSRDKAKTMNTSWDVLSWFIVHNEIDDALSETWPSDEKIRMKIVNKMYAIRRDKFSRQDWENLISTRGDILDKEILIKEMNKLCPNKPDTNDQLWYNQHQKLLKKISKYIVTGATVKCADLMAAIDAGIDFDILKYMIKHCANIHWRDKNNQNVLHHCAEHYMNVNLLQELLLYGASSSDLDKNLREPRDCLDKELWGDDYGSAKGLLRPGWTYFYCE